jgi:hypothetical protein
MSIPKTRRPTNPHPEPTEPALVGAQRPPNVADPAHLSREEITTRLQAARVRAAEEHLAVAHALRQAQQVFLECAELETAAAQLGGDTLAASAPSSDTQPQVDPAWLTPRQVANRVHRSIDAVYEALESGELHGHQRKRKGRWTVRPAAADAWNADGNSAASCGCRKLRLAKRGA